MDKIYEITDTSNDEMYYPLTIFKTLPEAIAWVESFDENTPITEFGCDDELEEVTIREREYGKHGVGKEVFKLNREAYYKEEDEDTLYWRTTKP